MQEPYQQSIAYNAFGDMTHRASSVWGGTPSSFTNTYLNGRKQNGNEVFDASGNTVDKTVAADVYDRWTYDAAGALTGYKKRYKVNDGVTLDLTNEMTQVRDGSGEYVKRRSTRSIVQSFPPQTS